MNFWDSAKKTSPWAIGSLVVSNLVPLGGVIWLDWDVRYLVLSYWFENLVIGGYTVLRMLTAQGNMEIRSPLAWVVHFFLTLLAVAFFLIHYGGFCGAHGLFLLSFFQEGTGSKFLGENVMSDAFQWPGPLAFFGLLVQVLKTIIASRPPGIGWMVAGLCLSHGISFITNYLGRGEFRKATPTAEMGRPYKHVVLLHVAILAGGIPVMLLGSPLPLLILLILGKLGLDLRLQIKAQEKMSDA